MKRRLSVISFILFILFLILYLLNRVNNIDNYVYNSIIIFKTSNITSFMKIITFFASTKFIIFLIILVLLIGLIINKKFLLIDLIIAIEILFNNVVKLIVKRDRPRLINLVTERSYSFPSGHVMTAVVVYVLLIYFINKYIKNKCLKYILISLCILLMILILVSRIYLGAHYFSDCMAGLFLSFSYIMYVIDIVERKKLL